MLVNDAKKDAKKVLAVGMKNYKFYEENEEEKIDRKIDRKIKPILCFIFYINYSKFL